MMNEESFLFRLMFSLVFSYPIYDSYQLTSVFKE